MATESEFLTSTSLTNPWYQQEVPSSQEGRRKSSVAAGTIVMDLNAGSSEVKDGTNSGKVSPHPGEVYSNRASRQSQKSTGNNRAGSTDVRKTPQKPEEEEWYYIDSYYNW